MKDWKKISLRPEDRSIDGIETQPAILRFDGGSPELAGGEIIKFKRLKDGGDTFERVGRAVIVGTNGTYIFTPSACNDELEPLDVDAIPSERLEGNFLVINLDESIAYGREEIHQKLLALGIELEPRTVPEYIVFFRTGIMKRIQGGESPEQRPGITPEGAQFLADLNIAKAYGIDGESFEVRGHNGFPATQLLQKSDPVSGDFVPLIYQLRDLDDLEGYTIAKIGIGNPPRHQPSWPVRVEVA